jgi:hypothetical protein
LGGADQGLSALIYTPNSLKDYLKSLSGSLADFDLSDQRLG